MPLETFDDIRQKFFEVNTEIEKLITSLRNLRSETKLSNSAEEKIRRSEDILGSVMSTIEFAGEQLDED